MIIEYNSKTDLLYLRIDSTQQEVINRVLSEDIVIDIGRDNKIAAIEIIEASRHVNFDKLMPVDYKKGF